MVRESTRAYLTKQLAPLLLVLARDTVHPLSVEFRPAFRMSIMEQRHHRIDSGSAACRNVTGDKRYDHPQ